MIDSTLCLVAVSLLIAGLASLAAGGARADGTARTLIWAATGGLFLVSAVVVALAAVNPGGAP